MGNILTHGLLLLFLIFFIAPLIRSHEKESVECHPDDRAALLEFKAAFPPDAFSMWDANVGCCNWEGIICHSEAPDRVFALLVHDRTSVRGSIPPAIGRLEFLHIIVLEKLPNLVGSIPHELTNLKSLQMLTISDTSLSTPIPSFFEEFPLLWNLILTRNNHPGLIPGSIFQNGNDRSVRLDLSGNRLSGLIPLEFEKINFDYINLTMNQLTGDASFLFGRSKRARAIDLSQNQLDFNLTDVVFPDLYFLRLNNNKIRGIIPAQIANVTTLVDLNLSHNHLCGKIPTGGNLRKFGPSSYSNNSCPCSCLCGTPLPSCPWDNWPSHAIF